ncbi:MAG TPA: phenylalanine--tRNA ligase subunit beta [Lachnospiraceae bacterium]|nr:phenylalanine--tRNA ligase subunit beta [Lachnospiraceae bacterium]
MNTSLSWIKKYVPDLDVTPQEYVDAMTLSGTKAEGYVKLDADLDKIVVGQIKKVEKHPDAEKLVICQVDVGDRNVQIVTGAPNVAEGQKVPVVLDGGKVAGGHDGKMTPGGIKIKKGKLRGVESDGMMCSIEELGSSRDMYPESPEYGIYVFQEDVTVGESAIRALGLDDVVVEYEITSNRVDCYSVIGIAREAAATFDKPFHPPVVKETGNHEDVHDYIRATVEDTDLCPRYCARVVKNVKIGPSPKWMQRCLASVGIRPINNLVDITNYVMEEYGQPMHAYDLATISDRHIIVKRASDGDTFVTLDGQERKLDHDVLMINDGEKAVGLAGIMGGENSMITDSVQDVLFEAACFDGTNIRLSAKRVGLRTEASGKFEKGLDPNNAEAAINRACQLMEELGAGEVVGGIVDVYPKVKKESRVPFEPDKINALLGTDISTEEMIGYLKRVELVPDADTGEILVPTFRQDIQRTADIAEEVARFFGYDNIPTTLPSGAATAGRISFAERIEQLARDVMEYEGFCQGYCYSFESPRVFDKLLLPADAPEREAIRISNPLGEDFSIMRTLSLNGILTSLATNYNHRNKSVKLYEIGNIYLPKELPLKELPEERKILTLGMYDAGDFFDMKGSVENFLRRAGIKGHLEYDAQAGKTFLHPGRQAKISYEGTVIGFLGEIHPVVADNYDLGARTYVAVIDIPAILGYCSFNRKYTGVAKFPAVMRDLSMVVPKKVRIGEIEHMISQRGGKLLEEVRLFDVYEGSQIDEGYKSVAFSVTFRAADRTLSEADITGVMKKILNGLESMGIVLRQ